MKRRFVTLQNNRKLGRRSMLTKQTQILRASNEFAFSFNDVKTPDNEDLVYAVYMQNMTPEQKQTLIGGGMVYTGRFRAKGTLFHEFVLTDTELHYQRQEHVVELMDSPQKVINDLKQNPGKQGYFTLDEFNQALELFDLGQVVSYEDEPDGYFMKWNGESWDISKEPFDA